MVIQCVWGVWLRPKLQRIQMDREKRHREEGKGSGKDVNVFLLREDLM